MLDDEIEKDPSAAVVTAARSQDGVIRASPSGCRPTVSTNCPDADQVVTGGVGGFGAVGDGDGAGEEPQAPTVRLARTAAISGDTTSSVSAPLKC